MRLSAKRTILSIAVALSALTASPAAGQPSHTTLSSDGEVVSIASTNEPRDTPRSAVYTKRVGGIVWLEGTFGVSRFNVTRFRSGGLLDGRLQSQLPSRVVQGPELGAALKFRAGPAAIGVHFRKADYEPFDMITAGLGFDFMVRAVPYVHPTIRFALSYQRVRGTPLSGSQGLFTGQRADGAGASFGFGLRVPLVKWVSLIAAFDYSVVALAVRGSSTNGGFVSAGTLGAAVSGTFALTAHLGGPRSFAQ